MVLYLWDGMRILLFPFYLSSVQRWVLSYVLWLCVSLFLPSHASTTYASCHPCSTFQFLFVPSTFACFLLTLVPHFFIFVYFLRDTHPKGSPAAWSLFIKKLSLPVGRSILSFLPCWRHLITAAASLCAVTLASPGSYVQHQTACVSWRWRFA